MRHEIILNKQGKQRVQSWLADLNADGKYLLEVRPNKLTRSLAQNRLSWMWYREIADFLTENSDQTISDSDVHDWLVDEFLPKKVIEIDGKPKVRQIGTSDLKVNEMSEFLEKVDVWAAQRSIQLTHPDIYGVAMGNKSGSH
ncbi:MAG: recombination protein NinB [Candidatus Thiodiazotropha sp.]